MNHRVNMMLITVLKSMIFATSLTKSLLSLRICSKHSSILHSNFVLASGRPTIDDVERISRGQAAKRRGTGSRAVPHRLNADERTEWDLAKLRKYVLLRGSGYRKERGDSPLANVFRLYCDSKSIPFVSVSRGQGLDTNDVVKIDLSPLRRTNVDNIVKLCLNEIQNNSHTYMSFISFDDQSNLTSLGWPADDDARLLDPIWRLPAINIYCTFGDRADSKRFAQNIVEQLSTIKEVI